MSIANFINGVDVVDIMNNIISTLHENGPISSVDFESLAYVKKFHPDIFEEYEGKIVYLLGLFYKTSDPQNLLEEAYSIFADAIEAETGRRFTPVQASAFTNIQNKRYFSFSAPTSAGKSFLFRELILNTSQDIIIVVPSRALISEYMFNVREILKDDKSVLILQFIENINRSKTNRRIYIITPERGDDLFAEISQLNIGLFLFDEAQISEENVRGMRFDSFVRRVDRIIPEAKKVFTHPFVENPEAQLRKHQFRDQAEHARYDQNTVGKIYLSFHRENFKYFSPYENVRTKTKFDAPDIVEDVIAANGTLLIYISKDKIYSGRYLVDFSKYIDLCPRLQDSASMNLINELREFIGASEEIGDKHSHMIDMMERGIVVHHGSVPLFARLLIEKFVNQGFAKICFATSTLTQGINMPFDVVWIDNFRFTGSENKKNLDLKNLIGRAGRSSQKVNNFDFGYVVIKSQNVNRFSNQMTRNTSLSEESQLDKSLDDIPEDLRDISEAIQNDTFDEELRLTETQLERMSNSDINTDIEFILSNFLKRGEPITGGEYYEIPTGDRNHLKQAFKRVYISHLRKTQLTRAESSVLSASIPILLWRIQGKSFKEIISLRHSYLTNKKRTREINAQLRRQEISASEAENQMDQVFIRYSIIASPLPNANASTVGLFPRETRVRDFDYDILVYDTYDYLDKVISLSLTDPLCAGFQLYFNVTNDFRALVMKNYIRYGTNDEVEIWLLRYGFGFEEIEWIKPLVESIDENEILFSPRIHELSPSKFEIIERYT